MRAMDVLRDFDRAATAARAVVDGVRPEQWGLPSPCAEWDVRGVLNHLVFGNLRAEASLRGRVPPEDRSADYLGGDPAAAFADSVTACREAFGEPGVLEKVVPTPLGEQPARFYVHMRINELLAHGWDVAAATGQSTDLVPDLAESALAMWHSRLGDKPRTGSPFGPAQPAPEGSTAADRLAAFLGRTVPATNRA
jgi:uncharacterized protein (TIGR03086 family)